MNDVVRLNLATRKHADGSPCREGTRQLPREYQPCCKTFDRHTATCVHEVRYEWHANSGWRIALAEIAGGGGIAIKHCPHCGTALK
jgi:hypothetical protein